LYCVLFGLVGMLLLSPSWVNSIVMHFLCSSMHCLCFLIHQVQLEYHFFNLQTWTLWEILSSLASHCSSEYLFPNFSMNTGLLRTMALFILTPDGYVFPNTMLSYWYLVVPCIIVIFMPWQYAILFSFILRIVIYSTVSRT
jgi:hypothetical protein